MDREQDMMRLRLQGYTYEGIGKEVGLSRQRAQQILGLPQELVKLLRQRQANCCALCGLYINRANSAGFVWDRQVGQFIIGYDKEVIPIDSLEYLCTTCARLRSLSLNK